MIGDLVADAVDQHVRILARPKSVDLLALLPEEVSRMFVWRGPRSAVTSGDAPK